MNPNNSRHDSPTPFTRPFVEPSPTHPPTVKPPHSPSTSKSAARLHPKTKAQRGIILPTVIFVILLSLAAGAILELSLSSYKLSKRNEMRARARALAESELEVFYYKFKEFLITGQVSKASDIPGKFTALGSAYVCDNASTPTTAGTPYVQFYNDNDALDTTNLESDDWIVRRSVSVSSIRPELAPDDGQYLMTGIIPNTNHKTGKFSYLVVRIVVEAGPTNPFYGKVSTKIGRRMSYATASAFQYNVFFQGDMEFAPGGNTVIQGNVASNGSIYMGASNGGSLTIAGFVSYLLGDNFNTTSDGVTATYRKPGTLAPNGATVTADATSLSAPIFTTGQADQVSTMAEKENLLGGLDATDIANRNPALFGALAPKVDPTTGETSYIATDEGINNVYRALIAPPPDALSAALGSSTDAQSAEYPVTTNLSTTADDDSIAALRAYNRAGLIITVDGTGNVTSIKDGDGTSHLTTLGSAVTTTKVDAITGVVSPLTLYDQREGKSVAITNIDIGALKTALDASTIDFNGLLYVLLANSSESTPAAVRLTNAATTPGINTTTQTARGFTVATNGGLYVKGDYNTTTTDGTSAISDTYTGKINPTLLMADAITVLSDNWDDANSTELGTSSTTSNITKRVAATGQTTINSAILTGNTSADSILEGDAAATASGGGQNLIRYMENWGTETTGVNSGIAKTVTLRGSLGRLFDSRHFSSTFQQPGNAYGVPSLRTFAFNEGLKTDDVPGQPLITYFSRGDFFNW